ncbi:Uncharacterised protein [Escherichia coli]|nr:Uncharacterised protein [Escherichia coli]
MKIKTTVAALSVLSVLSSVHSLPTPLMLHKHKTVKQSGPYP